MENPNTVAHSSALSPQSITFPPGFARVLTDHIYANSFIQIPEVSVCAAMALLAGLTGRAYRTPTGMDLAQYMILVASSGIGKDAIHEGIPNAIKAAGFVVGSENIVKQADFVSGAALHAAILQSPGFINLQGEFGRKLKRMSNPTDAPMQDLQRSSRSSTARRTWKPNYIAKRKTAFRVSPSQPSHSSARLHHGHFLNALRRT